MNRLKILILALTLSAFSLNCGIGTEDSIFKGGPGITPEDIEVLEEKITSALSDQLLTEKEDTDEDAEKNVLIEEESDIEDPAEAVSETAAVVTDDKEETTEEEAADKDEAAEKTDEKAEEETVTEEESSTIEYALNTSEGRWFETPEKELFTEEILKEKDKVIKALIKEIKKIETALKRGTLSEEAAAEQILSLREKIAIEREAIGTGGSTQKGIHTYWANESLQLNISNGESGWYKLVVIAKNFGKLPESYENFTIAVTDKSDGKELGVLSIKASEDLYYRDRLRFKLDDPAGKTIELVWKNDSYKKDETGTFDANIQIKMVELVKIKEPEWKKKPIRKGDEYSFVDGR